MSKVVAAAGFYGGKFLKAGQRYKGAAADDGAAAEDLDQMTKDELIAVAERCGVELRSDMLKAEILEALKAA